MGTELQHPDLRCGPWQALFTAVNYDGWGPGPENDHTGPTDDGTISTADQTFPGDPYCCQGPTPVPEGTTLLSAMECTDGVGLPCTAKDTVSLMPKPRIAA